MLEPLGVAVKAAARQKMTVLLMRAYAYNAGTAYLAKEQSVFVDRDLISSWAQNSVKAAYELGLTKGTGNDRFGPESVLTRAESAQAIVNLLKI